MRQVALRLWKFLGRLSDRRTSFPNARWGTRSRPPVRLELLSLESRITPSASTLGTLSGAVVLAGGVNPGQFFSLQGIEVTLTGTANQGDAVDMTATTDGSGTFAFRSVEAGTYELTALPDATLIQGGEVGGVTVVAGQSTTQDVTVGGLAAGVVSLRDFLNTPSQDAFGLPTAGATSDSPPVVSTPIANVFVASGGSTTIDLAANFSDPDTTDSQVVFDTSDGAMTVNLDDAQAPQTVANFLDYVENSRYDDTIFHRLDTNPPVLQGGGFGLTTNSSGDVTAFPAVANSNDPLLANEFSSTNPDAPGTLAMAKLSGNPNSASSQFFFNLADNTNTLGSSNNGGFAVFGSVASDPTSQAVFQALQSTPVQNESAFNPAFGGTDSNGQPTATFPIDSSADLTDFPTNTTPSEYLTINDVQVVKQDESLTYSIVGNSDPSLVNVSFTDGHPEVLSINPVGPSGTATITVQATDDFGLSVQTSFLVTVEPLAITSVTNPITDANVTSTTASGTATAGDSISVTATDGTTTTPAVTTTAAANGTWTSPAINVSSLTDGTITYTATTTDAAGNTLTASQTATKAIASQLTFTTTPISTTAGANSSIITVKVLDASGNPVANEQVNLSSSSETGTFFDSTGTTAITSVVTGADGTASFVYHDTTAGTPTLTATDKANTDVTQTQTETVTAAAAAQVAFTTAPQTFAAGTNSGVITVQIEDQFGNPVAQSGDTVNLTSSSGTGTFLDSTGTTPIASVPTNSSGAASFVYTDTATGTPLLTAADATNNTLTAGTQTETVD